MRPLSRRHFLTGLGVGAAALNLPVWARNGIALASGTPQKTLQDPDDNGLMLPPGFTSRVIAHTGKTLHGYAWHPAPDGGDVYATEDDGWIYVSNAEVPGKGGVGALRFDSNANITDAYPILENTQWNCAGGKTPWNTWLSCEEFPFGMVWECDPFGKKDPYPIEAMGVFKHEAAAVDPDTFDIYLTEDVPDGLLYKYVSDGPGKLENGTLYALARDEEDRLIWERVPKPLLGEYEPTRKQIANGVPFNGGEGAAYKDGAVYFSTKGDNKIWVYDIKQNTLRVLYDIATNANPILSGVDNVAITPSGDVVVAEDGGNNELVGLKQDGTPYVMLRLIGHDKSELCGPAFSPDGTRLYLASQRGAKGTNDDGMIFEVQGPFKSFNM